MGRTRIIITILSNFLLRYVATKLGLWLATAQTGRKQGTHKSITTMLDDPADDDTDDSDTEQPSQKIQIMDFFKKKGHKPGPEQLGQPNVKEKEKIIDMSKDHMDV